MSERRKLIDLRKFVKGENEQENEEKGFNQEYELINQGTEK